MEEFLFYNTSDQESETSIDEGSASEIKQTKMAKTFSWNEFQ